MPFTAVRGLSIYYEIRGSGPRLFSISRTGGDLRCSPRVFDMALAGAFEILAYDQRGLGRTSRPDWPCTMADYADDAAGLLDALGWEACAVLGFSFGGMVAQELALRHPRRVERLVLACTTSGGAGGQSYPLEELQQLPPEEYAYRLLPLLDSRQDDAWQAAHPDRARERVAAIMAGLRVGADEPGRRAGARRQLEARAGHDTWDRLARLRLPVYVCGATYDGLAAAASLRKLRDRIPGARLELFEAGHNFYVEDPQASARIAAFLRGELD